MPRNDNGDAPHTLGDAKVIGETDKAIRVTVNETTYWVPKSVVHDDSEVWKTEDEGSLVVKSWWAEKNGYA